MKKLSPAVIRALIIGLVVVIVGGGAWYLFSGGSTSYCATKAWMNAFTEGVHVELRSANSAVRAQALCPGYTLSEFHDVMGTRSTVLKMPCSPRMCQKGMLLRSSLMTALPLGEVIVIFGGVSSKM